MSDKLQSYIETRDKKLSQKGHYRGDELAFTFELLLTRKEVNVGGRASCGSSKNISWDIFTAWNEIVRKAQKLGYEISVERIPQKNGSPTRSGGFWHENTYTLKSMP